MAMRFDDAKRQILIVLYDYMLTSDSEAFWYSLTNIREALPPELSGAFARRALEALVKDEYIEAGVGDPEGEPDDTPVYALTEEGIEEAEQSLINKGWNLADYHPSPDVDQIVSRADEPEMHAAINESIGALAKQVRESNQAGALLGDHRDLIVDELETAERIASRDRFRLQRLTVYLVPTLKFVADKFVGTSISEAAKRLIELFAKFI